MVEEIKGKIRGRKGSEGVNAYEKAWQKLYYVRCSKYFLDENSNRLILFL